MRTARNQLISSGKQVVTETLHFFDIGKALAKFTLRALGLVVLRVSGKFKLRYESLENKFSLVHFAYDLIIGYSKNNIENYPKECF